jgi:putative transposase
LVKADERRHDGRVAVDTPNTRWWSNGFEIGCDNGEKVRGAFSLDWGDREAMGFVDTTAGISAEDVRDLMTATVEHRFGRVNRFPATIVWLTDNGGCYTVRETRRFAREINFGPRTTPILSPQSNGMAEAFIRTMKRDDVRVAEKPNARAVINQPPSWFHHYDTVRPHRALGYLARANASHVQPLGDCPGIKGRRHSRSARSSARSWMQWRNDDQRRAFAR